MRYQIILSLLYIFLSSITPILALDPYGILRISPDATDREVQLQYKKMRSKNRNSRSRKAMIRSAYSSIKNSRKYKQSVEQEEEQPEITKTAYPNNLNTHIDEAYIYGYRLPDEYDDGRYFKSTFNQTQFIMNRLNKSQENKKTAKTIVFLMSIIFKILPCICIFCLLRRRQGEENLLRDVLNRARNGYANYGRSANRRR